MSTDDPAETGPTLLVGPIASEAPDHDVVTMAVDSFRRAQLTTRFATVVLGSAALIGGAHARRLLIHNCAAHLIPGGTLVVADPSPDLGDHTHACGFEPADRQGQRWRRTRRRTIHDAVADARARYRRTTVPELARALDRPDPSVTVVDIRNATDRDRYGIIEGAVAVPRTVLEWRVDPTSGYASGRIPAFDRELVIVCNEGYSSSLAAAALQDFGFAGVSDLEGGMLAWIRAGHPVVEPDDLDDGFTPEEDLDDGPAQ